MGKKHLNEFFLCFLFFQFYFIFCAQSHILQSAQPIRSIFFERQEQRKKTRCCDAGFFLSSTNNFFSFVCFRSYLTNRKKVFFSSFLSRPIRQKASNELLRNNTFCVRIHWKWPLFISLLLRPMFFTMQIFFFLCFTLFSNVSAKKNEEFHIVYSIVSLTHE